MTCHRMEGGTGILCRGSVVTARTTKNTGLYNTCPVLQAVYLITRPELTEVRTHKHVFN